MTPLLHLHIDFDGTISSEDTTDLIFERFALPAWREVEAAWERGEIGSRDCMARQVDLLRVAPDDFDSFIADIPVDPGFPAFARMCRERGQPFTILSDGLDRVAHGVMRRLGLSVPIRSNRLEALGDGCWRLGFPHADAGCMTMAGNCKCAGMEAMRRDNGRPTALIGDGRSDFCGAGAATHVFAKGRLAAHCRDQGITHLPFAGFQDLTPLFADWLDRHFRPAVAAE